MKILSTKRYKKLLDIEEKYKYLNGEMFTLYIGGRSRTVMLLQMQKEELVKIIVDLHNDILQLKRRLEGKGDE